MEAVAHGLHTGKVLGHKFDEAFVIQMARRRDDHVSRRKALAIEVEDGSALEALDGVSSPQNRTSQRVILPEVLGKNFVDEVVRVVLVHLDFFKDYPALSADVLVIKNRIQD